MEGLKKKGIRVSGIGHRIKSKDNRDKRVELLQKYASKHFPSSKYIDFAVEVRHLAGAGRASCNLSCRLKEAKRNAVLSFSCYSAIS